MLCSIQNRSVTVCLTFCSQLSFQLSTLSSLVSVYRKNFNRGKYRNLLYRYRKRGLTFRAWVLRWRECTPFSPTIKGPTLETLDYAFYIGSTCTSILLYFNLYLNTAFAAHYVYFNKGAGCSKELA